MAKPVALAGSDLASSKSRNARTPTAELVPLQFKVDPAFVRSFKQAALDRSLNLTELFLLCFNELNKKGKR